MLLLYHLLTDPFPPHIKINPAMCCVVPSTSSYSSPTGDGNIWQITSPTQPTNAGGVNNACCVSGVPPTNIKTQTLIQGINKDNYQNTGEAMTCQELLALSGALSAALPTGQIAFDSFFNSLTKGIIPQHNFQPVGGGVIDLSEKNQMYPLIVDDDFSCCHDLYINEWDIKRAKCLAILDDQPERKKTAMSRVLNGICMVLNCIGSCMHFIKKYVKKLVSP